MDEFTATLRARELVGKVNPTTIPVPIEAYLAHISAVLRRDNLGDDEAGFSFESNGKHFICVNVNDDLRRQRFTACHEIAHIVLGLPSDHKVSSWWSYAKRSPAEMLCDVFAAELLLPYRLFKPIVEKASISLASVELLADQFEASTTATGSRFATVVSAPCAFVLSEQGKVRYSARSKTLREANAWVQPRTALPAGSLSERVRGGSPSEGPEEAEADVWFNDWERGGVLLEDAVHLAPWDQTLTLLWFEDEEIPSPKPSSRRAETGEEDTGLPELDGILPWPGKRRRK